MSANQIELNNLKDKGFCHWVHRVIMLAAAGLQGTSRATIRAVARAFISEIQKMNRILKMACQLDTVLLPDFLEKRLMDQKCQDELWRAVKEAGRIYFIMVVKDPANVGDLLPEDWGKNGYSNVCLVLLTDDSPDRNRENMVIFKEIPARFRALWIDTQSRIQGIDGLTDGIQWIIVDTWICAVAGSSTIETIKWVNAFRIFGQTEDIPVFHNGPECSDASILETQSMSPDHPFPAGIDLRRLPLVTAPSSTKESEKATEPASVEIEPLVSSVEASESTILQLDDTMYPSSGDLTNDVANPGPVSVPGMATESLDSLPVLPVSVEVTSKKHARFLELHDAAKKGFGIFTTVGQALFEIREDELWREGNYFSWDAYCKEIIGLSKSYANRLIRDAEIACELQLGKMPKSSCGEPILPANESQVRPLAKLEHPTQRRKAWKIAVKRAEGQPTAAIVAEVVCELVAEESPTTPQTPSPKERRAELVCELCKVAETESSWDDVRSICANLKLIL